MARWKTGHIRPHEHVIGTQGGCALYVPLDGCLLIRRSDDPSTNGKGGVDVPHSGEILATVERGQMVLVTQRDSHVVVSDESKLGFLYGQLDTPHARDLFLESLLGEHVILDIHGHPYLAKCGTLIALIRDEIQARVPGWRAMVNRLILSLVIQALRTVAMQAQCKEAKGRPSSHWILAAFDPILGPVLRKMHLEPDRDWTVPSLAKECHMSKSAFSERFRQLVGKPPLNYLTEFRIQRACEMLVNTQLDVVEISKRVGYDSASSFSNAFKRLIGDSPVAYRRNSRSLQEVL